MAPFLAGMNQVCSGFLIAMVMALGISDKKDFIRYREEASRQMYLAIHEDTLELRRHVFSQTWQGHLFNILGYIFLIYCCYKMVISPINVIFDRGLGKDPVTWTIEKVLSLVDLRIDLEAWSQSVSFILVGILVFTSVRGLLLQLAKAFASLSGVMGSEILVLLLAWLMGAYFIAHILMLRMSMPITYRAVIDRAVGTIEFGFYHRWFDMLFFVSSIVSVFFLYFSDRVYRADSSKHK